MASVSSWTLTIADSFGKNVYATTMAVTTKYWCKGCGQFFAEEEIANPDEPCPSCDREEPKKVEVVRCTVCGDEGIQVDDFHHHWTASHEA